MRIIPSLIFVLLHTHSAQATWSIVGANSKTKEVGIAIASCLPHHLRVATGKLDLCDQTLNFSEQNGERLAAVSQGMTVPGIPLGRSNSLDDAFKNLNANQILTLATQLHDPRTDKQYGIVDTTGSSGNSLPEDGYYDWLFNGSFDYSFGHIFRKSNSGRLADIKTGDFTFAVQGNTLSSEKMIGQISKALQSPETVDNSLGFQRKRNCDLADRMFNALIAGTEVDGKVAGDNRCVNPNFGRPVPATDACLVLKGTEPELDIRVHNDPNAIEVLKNRYKRWRMRNSCDEVLKQTIAKLPKKPADQFGRPTFSIDASSTAAQGAVEAASHRYQGGLGADTNPPRTRETKKPSKTNSAD